MEFISWIFEDTVRTVIAIGIVFAVLIINLFMGSHAANIANSKGHTGSWSYIFMGLIFGVLCYLPAIAVKDLEIEERLDKICRALNADPDEDKTEEEDFDGEETGEGETEDEDQQGD